MTNQIKINSGEYEGSYSDIEKLLNEYSYYNGFSDMPYREIDETLESYISRLVDVHPTEVRIEGDDDALSDFGDYEEYDRNAVAITLNRLNNNFDKSYMLADSHRDNRYGDDISSLSVLLETVPSWVQEMIFLQTDNRDFIASDLEAMLYIAELSGDMRPPFQALVDGELLEVVEDFLGETYLISRVARNDETTLASIIEVEMNAVLQQLGGNNFRFSLRHAINHDVILNETLNENGIFAFSTSEYIYLLRTNEDAGAVPAWLVAGALEEQGADGDVLPGTNHAQWYEYRSDQFS